MRLDISYKIVLRILTRNKHSRIPKEQSKMDNP